jgi:hypothetical protein
MKLYDGGRAPNPRRVRIFLAEKGITPPGVDVAHQQVRSASVILPPDQPFKDAAREALKVRSGLAPATV